MMHRLERRLSALECAAGNDDDGRQGPAVWIVAEAHETPEQAVGRFEALNGPVGNRPILTWLSPQETEEAEL